MKILFVSSAEPKLFGPVSRLLYDILWAYEGKEKIDFTVMNVEQINVLLPDNIRFVPWSSLIHFERKNNSNFAIGKVKYEWVQYRKIHINAKDYDCIISFPFLPVALDYQNFSGKYETIAVDSASMVFTRGFVNHKSKMYRFLSLIRLKQNARIDKICVNKSSGIYTVGISDAEAYNVFYNSKAHFIPHTVTDDVIPYLNRVNWSGEGKLKICFSGSLSYFYTGEIYKEIIMQLLNSNLQNNIEIHFLGKKFGYLDQLQKAGYDVYHEMFVPSYEEYLSSKHVLIVPLLVGAGTKNRVLSAIAVGMDVIGTSVAMENIYGVEEENIANTATEFIEKIRQRVNEKKIYNYSCNKVNDFLQFHGKRQWTEKFWDRVL